MQKTKGRTDLPIDFMKQLDCQRYGAADSDYRSDVFSEALLQMRSDCICKGWCARWMNFVVWVVGITAAAAVLLLGGKVVEMVVTAIAGAVAAGDGRVLSSRCGGVGEYGK
ncbi:Hypothetical predicted protein [Olea europaea subsp. europaea]|uniref:Uncharacterized protein n=1 Tax=Olea europaea subsp. europaea TaxID=158383 RepID=A0A8S0PPU5_OLEEU|nr:Hypothetical predicted protein [Olea europaea subsp. europaea]